MRPAFTIGAKPPDKEGRFCRPIQRRPDRWSSEDKFRTVLETMSMSQADFSAYCRKHGLYPEQVQRWKAAWAAGNDRAEAQARHRDTASRQARQRIKKLESELRRKDKALAETAALLALSKRPRRSGAATTRPTEQPPGSPAHRCPGREGQRDGARLAKACAVVVDFELDGLRHARL